MRANGPVKGEKEGQSLKNWGVWAELNWVDQLILRAVFPTSPMIQEGAIWNEKRKKVTCDE